MSNATGSCSIPHALELLRKHLPKDAAEDAIDKLERGRMSIDAAEKLLRLYREQTTDQKTRKVSRPNP